MINRFEFILDREKDGTIKGDTRIESLQIHFNQPLPQDFKWYEVKVPGNLQKQVGFIYVSNSPRTLTINNNYVTGQDNFSHEEMNISCTFPQLSFTDTTKKIDTNSMKVELLSRPEFADFKLVGLHTNALKHHLLKVIHSGFLTENEKCQLTSFVEHIDENIAAIKETARKQFLLRTKKTDELRQGISATGRFFSEPIVKEIMDYVPDLFERKPTV